MAFFSLIIGFAGLIISIINLYWYVRLTRPRLVFTIPSGKSPEDKSDIQLLVTNPSSHRISLSFPKVIAGRNQTLNKQDIVLLGEVPDCVEPFSTVRFRIDKRHIRSEMERLRLYRPQSLLITIEDGTLKKWGCGTIWYDPAEERWNFD